MVSYSTTLPPPTFFFFCLALSFPGVNSGAMEDEIGLIFLKYFEVHALFEKSAILILLYFKAYLCGVNFRRSSQLPLSVVLNSKKLKKHFKKYVIFLARHGC